jgi:hypothetical protein
MGKTIGVYINDIEDAMLETEVMKRRCFLERQKGCDSVAKLIRGCVRETIKQNLLPIVSVEGTQ